MPGQSAIDQVPSQGPPLFRASNYLHVTPSTNPSESHSPRSSVYNSKFVRKEWLYPGQKRPSEYLVNTVQGRESQKRSRMSVRRDPADEETPLLACPFAKLDGSRHYACLKFELHRMRDLKQHLFRKHMGPEFYCAVCWQTFPNRSTQDEHVMTRVCSNRLKPPFERISEEQRRLLKRRGDRRATLEQQWYNIWDILFPEKQQPSSIYLGNFMEETLSYVGNRCQDADWDKLVGDLKKRHDSRVDEELVKDIVMVALEWFHTIIDTKPADDDTEMVATETLSHSGEVSPSVPTSGFPLLEDDPSPEDPFRVARSRSDIHDLGEPDYVMAMEEDCDPLMNIICEPAGDWENYSLV